MVGVAWPLHCSLSNTGSGLDGTGDREREPDGLARGLPDVHDAVRDHRDGRGRHAHRLDHGDSNASAEGHRQADHSRQFDFDKSAIRPADEAELAKAIAFDKKYPNSKISLDGYTDAIGSVPYNLALSERRAVAVKNYLAQKGGIPGA